MTVRAHPDTICLFDVDGTLTPARQTISKEMLTTLAELKKKCTVGFVGGSDLVKQEEQLGHDGLKLFDYMFAENGLVAYKDGKLLSSESFINWIGETKYQRLVNFILRYIAQLDIPVKRGTFIEFRNGMINVSPIGRNCNKQERNEFEEFDKKTGIRTAMVEALKKEFADYGLTYSIGGQISFDVFPTGWDKTYCLRHLDSGLKNIHFFGDKTYAGGNDYEIYTHPSVKGHSVKNPEETIAILKDMFLK